MAFAAVPNFFLQSSRWEDPGGRINIAGMAGNIAAVLTVTGAHGGLGPTGPTGAFPGVDALGNLLVGASGTVSGGTENTIVGALAGPSSITQTGMAILGYQAASISPGDDVIAVGNLAGMASQGTNAISIGFGAGKTSQGGNGIAIGTNAGLNFQGSPAIAIGNGAGSASQGGASIAIGSNSGSVVQGGGSISIGANSGRATQGANSIAIGGGAGQTVQGTSTIAIGNGAGQGTQAFNSIAIGLSAGSASQASNSVAIGASSGQNNQGTNSIAIGNTSGSAFQGNSGIAIGQGAGQASQGAGAIAIGGQAGQTSQAANSIVITASGVLNAAAQGFYVQPVRTSVAGAPFLLMIDNTTGEIAHSSSSTVTTKTFVVDHPTEPSKYLVHGCLEGPEAGVYYRGHGVIEEGNGETAIVLPSYIDALAADFTVSITPVFKSLPIQLMAATKVKNGQFTVHGSAGEFSWIVHGKRADIEVEPDKHRTVLHGSGPYKWSSSV